MKSFTSILWGLVLVFLGVILGLNALDITDINIFFNGWWTLFIIIPSFIGLFKEQDRVGNIIGLIIGVLLLLATNNIINFSLIWKLFFPIILVIIGLSFVFKNSILNRTNARIKELNSISKDKKEYYSTFSGQTINFENEKFEGVNLYSTFGGIKCNLSGADIKNEAVINVSCVFGGVDLIVPNNIKVITNSNSIFGGIDAGKHRCEKEEKVIYVNATCMFGGVDIK